MKGRMHTGERGLSTLVIGAGILNLNVALTTFQEGMAKNGLRPNAVIQTDANLSEEQFKRVKTEIDEMLQNAVKGGKPALLEAGLKYEAIAMDAMKSDLNKARQLARHEAAALLRVPAYKVGASESEKYDNKAAAEQTYVDDCLIPIVGRAEAILCRALLTEKERLQGYALEFDRDDLYDRDRQQASTRIVEQFKSGVITRGQANLALGYDAVDDALDTYMIPVNSAVLKKDGTIDYVMPQKASPDAPKEPEEPKEEPKKGFIQQFLPSPTKSEAKQPINVTVNMPEQKPAHMNIDVRPSGSKTITMVPKEDGSAEFIVKEAA
jgi:hypothetical protein